MTASIIMYRVWSSWLVPSSWTRKGLLRGREKQDCRCGLLNSSRQAAADQGLPACGHLRKIAVWMETGACPAQVTVCTCLCCVTHCRPSKEQDCNDYASPALQHGVLLTLDVSHQTLVLHVTGVMKAALEK
jgi:hypothetical protein